MSKFSISPSLGFQYPDNILGMTLADPENHFEYSSCLLSMSGSVSYLWGIVFASVSCGCSLGAGFCDLWSHPVDVVLFPMYRRNSLSSSVSLGGTEEYLVKHTLVLFCPRVSDGVRMFSISAGVFPLQ